MATPSVIPHRKSLDPTVYIGTFIHTLPSVSPTHPSTASLSPEPHTPIAVLEVLEQTAIWVDERGIIVRIDKNIEAPNDLVQEIEGGTATEANEPKRKWKIVGDDEEGRRPSRWWFPGFVGKCYIFLAHDM